MLRKSFGYLVAVLVAAANVAPTFGGIVPTATLIKDPANGIAFGSPDAALGAPWVSYVLSVTADGGDMIQAAEVVNITGMLHQRWTDPDDGGTFGPSGNSTNKVNGDSHLLATSSMLFANGPNEDNPGTGSPLSGGNSTSTLWGVGTGLSGTFGPPGAALTSMELAYLVFPSTNIPDIAIKLLNPNGDVIRTLTQADFFPGGGGDPPVVGDLNLSTTSWNQVIGGIVPATGADSLAFNDINNPTFTPLIPGQTRIFDNVPTLDNAGNFSWDTTGTRRGTYAWAVTGTNPDGTDGGLISVEVTRIPEPATMSMLGLALVGLVGFARRRS